MTQMEKFKASIKVKHVEGNRTFLSTTFNGCEYGQSYPNTVCTIEGMIDRFVAFYYPFVEAASSRCHVIRDNDVTILEQDQNTGEYTVIN